MGKFISSVLLLLSGFVIFVILSLFFIKLGWSWFVVSVFGLPELTWLQALGFSFLASCFRSSGNYKVKE